MVQFLLNEVPFEVQFFEVGEEAIDVVFEDLEDEQRFVGGVEVFDFIFQEALEDWVVPAAGHGNNGICCHDDTDGHGDIDGVVFAFFFIRYRRIDEDEPGVIFHFVARALVHVERIRNKIEGHFEVLGGLFQFLGIIGRRDIDPAAVFRLFQFQ